eukprot:SAG22_NODE_371_length_11566_cov_5.447458_3_plen_191_part_00
MHWTDVHAYIERYVETKGLRPHIRLSTAVTRVSPDGRGDAGWTVTTASTDTASGTATTAEESFDAVIVSTGHHSVPNIPDFPGAAEFGGEMIHSHSYKDNTRFRGKRVVTIGIGNSSSVGNPELACCCVIYWLSLLAFPVYSIVLKMSSCVRAGHHDRDLESGRAVLLRLPERVMDPDQRPRRRRPGGGW